MKHSRITILIPAVAALCACEPAQQVDRQAERDVPRAEAAADQAADRAAIAALLQRERDTFSAGDRRGISSVFTDDVILMPPGEPALQGAEARDRWLAALYRQYSVETAYTDSALTIVGDHAYETLAFRMTLTPVGGGESSVQIGKGLHIYERQPDGGWKIAVDIWNTDG